MEKRHRFMAYVKQEKPLVNRVAQSGIITIDLEKFLPEKPVVELDLKQFLVKELVLMEKPFREMITAFDWGKFKDAHTAVCCSSDAIIPMWAYMLVTSKLLDVTDKIYYGSKDQVEEFLLLKNIESLDAEEYRDKRVVIKGCGEKTLSPSVFIAITRKLQPVVTSLMYGEPCSTVPVYKRKKDEKIKK